MRLSCAEAIECCVFGLWRTINQGEVFCAAGPEDAERLAASQFVFDLGDGFLVDAQRMGNRTRRINHSDEPNVRAQTVNHRGQRKVCICKFFCNARATAALPRIVAK
eukprot:SAG11_NODE_3369_length_2493_cov_2.073935_4_plen_107_part_00